MKHLILTLTAIVVLAGCRNGNLFSHSGTPITVDPPPQASDLTADQLIAKYAAARGGQQNLEAIRSVTMSGRTETKQISSSPITLTVAPGRYLRRTEPGDGVVMIKAVNGQTCWEVLPQAGILKPAPMIDKEATRYRRLADPQGPLFNPQAKGNKIEVIGKLPWRNTQLYKLKVTYPDGGSNFLYLDAQSFLPVRLVSTMYIAPLQEDVDIEFTYEGYRDVNGVKWPFTEKANAPEVNFTQVMSWEKIEPNKPYDESAFQSASFVAPKKT